MGLIITFLIFFIVSLLFPGIGFIGMFFLGVVFGLVREALFPDHTKRN